jgi:hypothetical protein
MARQVMPLPTLALIAMHTDPPLLAAGPGPLPAVQRGRCRSVRMTPVAVAGVHITGRSGRSVSAKPRHLSACPDARCPPACPG